MHVGILEAIRRKSQKKRANTPEVSTRPPPPVSSLTTDNLVPTISPSVLTSSSPIILSISPLLDPPLPDPPAFVFPEPPEEFSSPSILQNPNSLSSLTPISKEDDLAVANPSPTTFQPSLKASPSYSLTFPSIVLPTLSSPTLPEDASPSLTSQNPNSSSLPFCFVSEVIIATSNLSPLAPWLPSTLPSSLSQEVSIYPSSISPSHVLSRSSSEISLPSPIEVIQHSDVMASSSIPEHELTLLPLPSPLVSLPSRDS